jgi:hypothetical protein
MKALINGSTNASVTVAKGSNNSLNVLVMNDDGSVLALSTGTIDLVVYDRSDRANAAIATHAGAGLSLATAGFDVVDIDDSALTYGPGEYYVFVKHTTAGGTFVYFSAPFVLIIR